MLRPLLLIAALISLAACNGEEGLQVELDPESRRGQWVVVNYWAEWCKPCIHEIPELNALDRDYSEITVLGVNYDALSGAELAAQVESLGITFPTLVADPSATLGIERPMVLPTTVIISPEGVVHQTLIGPQTVESLVTSIGL